MKWMTLFNRIARQPAPWIAHHDVTAVLLQPGTENTYKTYPMCLKYDAAGHPYLIVDNLKLEKEKANGRKENR